MLRYPLVMLLTKHEAYVAAHRPKAKVLEYVNTMHRISVQGGGKKFVVDSLRMSVR